MAENDVTINEPLDGNLEPPVEPLVGELSEPESLTGTLDGELLRGYSAYEIAIQNGFVGTEEEWLLSLIGAKGDKGDTGDKGDKGDKGDQGPQGIRGEKGDTGDKGDHGEKGETGDQGLKGEKGDKGDTGDRGPTGYGIGIRTVTQNSNYTITFVFDDGRVYTTPNEVRGLPGENGKSVTVTQSKSGGVTTIVFSDAETLDPIAISVINDGEKGDKGDPGEKGETGDTGPQGIQGIQGEKGDTGAAGQDGYTPVRGTDYWTASDKAEIETDLERSSVVTGKADKVSDATSGNFAGLDANGNLTDSGHKHSDYLTQHQDISGKADKVSSAVNGNFAGLDANGNLTDSGKKASDFLTQHQDISGKADKVTSAVSGNFASLDSNGNLVDSGHKHSDYVVTEETISGSTPSITGVANHRYICDEVATLSITPPNSGCIDILFESGSTATVLTVPNTVKFPAWFDPTNLEANCIYEINILDGVYGAVMTWT